jgi:hypothetical protein
MLSVGWVGLANKPAAKSDSVVQLLESMGAVLYAKTNVPQSLMVCSCLVLYLFSPSRCLKTNRGVDVRLLQPRFRPIRQRLQ